MKRSLVVLALGALSVAARTGSEPNRVITFSDDGGWCWFEDERVIVHGGKLIIGSVASGAHDPARQGDIEAVVYDLATGSAKRCTMHHSSSEADRKGWMDDHNSPAFLVRPDGRILVMYSRHNRDEKIHYRITVAPGEPANWGDERVFVPSQKSRVTYTNLHWLARENGGKGRIYDFYRGLDDSFKPSYAYSDDFGETWVTGNVFVNVPTVFRHRPYVKYASNGRDTVHIAYTDGHPQSIANSVYHIYYAEGMLHRSDGAVIRSLAEGLKSPEEGTCIFQGDPNNVGWVSDLHIDTRGYPCLVYSVQKDSAGLPRGQAGEDLRYRYARWDGKRWIDHEIAYAGAKLYPGEDHYTGNITIDPGDPGIVYISTNADPVTGKPLISRTDGARHWEIFRGATRPGGAKWTWTPVTRDSGSDNIRPIVPIWDRKHHAVLWLRGKMRAYADFDFAIVGLIGDKR